MIACYCILFISVMTIKKWVLFVLFISGLVILLLPDQGAPVIKLNERHGPSFLDLIGLALIVISWALSCIVVIRNWNDVKLSTGSSNSRLLILVYVLSIIGVALSLLFSSDVLLWCCAAIGFFINILFIVYAFRNGSDAN